MTDVAFWYDAQPCIYLCCVVALKCIQYQVHRNTCLSRVINMTRDVADPDGVQ